MATFSECVDFTLKYSGLGDENLILKDKQIQIWILCTKGVIVYQFWHFVRRMTESSSNGFLGNTDEVRWRYGIGRVSKNAVAEIMY